MKSYFWISVTVADVTASNWVSWPRATHPHRIVATSATHDQGLVTLYEAVDPKNVYFTVDAPRDKQIDVLCYRNENGKVVRETAEVLE